MSGNNALCANCRFWMPPANRGEGMGQCRHNPPQSFMVMIGPPQVSREEEKIIALAGARRAPQQGPQPMFMSAWPPVGPDGWCGEHREIDK